MKIIKKNKLLLEDIDQNIQEPDEVIGNKQINEPLDLDTASADEIVADMAIGAKKAGLKIDVDEAEEEAEEIQEIIKVIRNPKGSGQPQILKQLLQDCLDTALDQREIGDESDFPNIIIYGLAGFGKTSIVKQFCREHNIYLFECDAKNLDSAIVGGIPYPKQDYQSGEYFAAPIASRYWDSLDNNGYEYSILFLDELNRANGRTIGSLLTLMNEHTLPAFIEDPKTKKTKVTRKFNNILFTVSAINPASDIFPDTIPLDPATVSRNTTVYEQKADPKEFYNRVNEVYTAILKLNLSQRLYAKYFGQRELAKAILNSSQFKFNDTQVVKDKFFDSQNQGKIINYLNYRTLMLQLKGCDGTKDGFLRKIKYSGLGDADIKMFESILSTYKDKPVVGNNIWGGQGQQSTRSQASEIEAANRLSDFIDTIDD